MKITNAQICRCPGHIRNFRNLGQSLKKDPALEVCQIGQFLEFLLVAGLMALVTSELRGAPHPFTKITQGAIATDEGSWIGCSWGDYDNDGYLDLFVGNGTFVPDGDLKNALYRNNRDGTFTKITDGPVVNDIVNSYGGVWGDYDNDGFLDLFVANEEGKRNCLYRNKGNGTFEKITQGNVVTDEAISRAAAWGDFNKDGWLDLYVATGKSEPPDLLYRNNGDGTFTRVQTGDLAGESENGNACAWLDYDGDGWLDMVVANWNSQSLYRNVNGALTKITEGDVATDDFAGTGVDAGDYDNDGDLDLFFTAFWGAPDRLFRNDGNGVFTRISDGDSVNDTAHGNGCAWADYDNDGDLDLVVANAAGPNFLYENNGDGTFVLVTEGAIATETPSGYQGCAWGDYNNDGFIDLFIADWARASNATNLLFRNDGNANSWIKIRCVGTKSNRSGFGAKVRVRANLAGSMRQQMREISGGSGYASQNAPEAHFGLKDAMIVDTVRVEWPSGIIQELRNVPARQILTITEYETMPLTALRPGFTVIDFQANNTVRFAIKGELDKTYQIQISKNLTDWSVLKTIRMTRADGTEEFVDDSARAGTVCFYRLLLLP